MGLISSPDKKGAMGTLRYLINVQDGINVQVGKNFQICDFLET